MDWNGGGGGGEEKGLLWRLPVLKAKDLGKVGPGIGFGAGCGVGFGVGLVGGGGHCIHLLVHVSFSLLIFPSSLPLFWLILESSGSFGSSESPKPLVFGKA